MKKVFYFLMAAAMLALLGGCERKEFEQSGSISGVVTDKATSEPVRAAGVQLSTGAKTVTGNDGQYEFAELKVGEYTLQVSKTGYTDLVGYKITVEPDKAAKGDVQVEKLPPSLRVVNDSKQDISELNFGSAEADLTRSFSIFNDGPEPLEWDITYTAAWISKVSRESGTLKAGATQAIVVTIDREKLNGGDNTTTIQVTSDNGSKQLTVKAAGVAKALPTLNTLAVSGVTASTATFNGSITSAGVPPYTERGFVYATAPMPTVENTIAKLTAQVTDSASYRASVANLTLSQTYYVRAYAVSSVGTAYSTNEVSFTPSATQPTLSTQAVTNKNVGAGTATFNGAILTVGDPAYTERGFVYGKTQNPTVDDTKKVASGSGTGAYSLNVTDIEEGATYYVRAYATNAKGTAYGEQVSLAFTAAMPALSVQAATSISVGAGTATFNGKVESVGDLSYTERGFVYAAGHVPTLSDTKVATSGAGTAGTYSLPVTGIAEGYTYRLRAYATNAKGTAYSSNEVSLAFTAVKPTLSTQAVSNKNAGAGTATFNGTILTVGDPAYTERGFVYGTAPSLTIDDSKQPVSGSSTGEFSANMAGLTPDQLYYVRAYATTPKGTEYGDALSFTLERALPSVSTQAATSINIANGTATFNGTMVSAGDPAYTERGFVYGTSPDPTIDDATKLSVSGSSTNFSFNATGLEEGKTYYVRAYATNAKGAAYGESVTLSFVAAAPALSTQAATNISISAGTATFNGTIVSAGDPAYTERGFVYGLQPAPTVEDENVTVKTVAGTAAAFTSNITGLTEGKIYYIRSYATALKGTEYGAQVTLDFNAVMPVVTTQAVTEIAATTATFNGTIVSAGDPAYTERGFVYGRYHNPIVEDDTKKVVSSSGQAFYANVEGLTTGTLLYVRAYATTSKGAAYGEEVSFTPNNPNVVLLPTAKLMVQKTDIGIGYWSDMNSLCNNSMLDGYTDWRLPTKDELAVLYNERNTIGGFTTTSGSSSYYWSSSVYTSSYWYQSFSSGAQDYSFDNTSFRARCVRNY
jgi:hypothetical protein